ncbi:hypothetical protein [Chitinophaga flava]|uniref:Lipocalin-like domain-containing protein n=1 Tax=Chitinophaga flava TaxID=2259036 RepID=A0A365XZR8_9BACT|nr:hypothetical protein [Chitinophaga flava]RBL91842.1 hypothetical protein DF182_04360 [Chitinophaga flava]
MTRTYLFLSAFLAVMAVSCSKEPMAGPDPDPETTTPTSPGANPSNKLVGVWKNAGVRVIGQSIAEMNLSGDAMRSVTEINYTSFNNKGTVTFDETTTTSSNISYSIDTKLKIRSYTNGILDANEELPWKIDMPASNGKGQYKLIGTDSMYTDNGVSSMVGSDGKPLTSVPATFKISWSGDTLILVAHSIIDKTQQEYGITQLVHYDFYHETKLTRK